MKNRARPRLITPIFLILLTLFVAYWAMVGWKMMTGESIDREDFSIDVGHN